MDGSVASCPRAPPCGGFRSSSVSRGAQSRHQTHFTPDLSVTRMWGHFSVADKANFLRLADLLNVQVITVNIRRHPLENWVPRVYQSSASLLVQRMVRHR